MTEDAIDDEMIIRSCQPLVEQGLMERTPDGYRITEKGRAALEAERQEKKQ